MPRTASLILTALFAFGIGAAPLVGQGVVPFAGGGVAFGTGDLAEDTDTGWFVLGGLDIPLDAIIVVGLSARAAMSHARIPFAGEFGDAMSVTGLTWELRYHFLPPANLLRPYVEGGAGLNVHRYDPGDLDAAETGDVRAAGVAGAGVNLIAGPVDLVLGVRFTSGEDAGFYGVHAGLAFPIY